MLVKEELVPLFLPEDDEINAIRFDALMYGLELAHLFGKKYSKAKSDLYKKIKGIAGVANIPEIQIQSELINQLLNTDLIDRASIEDLEMIRINIRNLIKYIPKKMIQYETNLNDDILSIDWHESNLENDDFNNYREKIEHYIREHQQDAEAINKLKMNTPLSKDDVSRLEDIIWHDLGTKEQYYAEYGEKPLGEFVREIIGLDMNVAK
ncbi:hypothetical protein BN3662_02928 [Clostridiales bacterium CHKCI006]|nr:hypothetical protein BN3662_02928 [Clostridiales bacterium CHKCI006]